MHRWGKLLVLLALAGFIASLPGCSGCWEDPIAKKQRLEKEAKEREKKEQEEEQEKEQKKPDFETEKLQVLPGERDQTLIYTKPGHWTVANQPIIANNFEFRGRITSTATQSNGAALRLEGMPHALRTSRPLPLPQGQMKDAQLLFFPPRRTRNTNDGPRNIWMQNSVRMAGTGSEVMKKQEGLSEMKAYEYHLLVLADTPDDYGYLKLLHSTQPLVNDTFSSSTISHYRISLPKIRRKVPLPDNSLAWTSIGVIVWDDLDPNLLTLDQKNALLDWLHFGGQLIVSGPRSYSTLKGSDLEDYLPVTDVEGVNLSNEDFQSLSDHWTITGAKETLPIIVPDQAPLLGLNMTPHAAAFSPPGCEGLVLERRVGRGRICFTAFPLDADPIKNWPSFDSFVNAVLLQRPAREYQEDRGNLNIELHYADDLYLPRREDPRLNTLVRYFSRDVETMPELTSANNPAAINQTANTLSGVETRVDRSRADRRTNSPSSDSTTPNGESDSPNTAGSVETYAISRTPIDEVDPRFGGWENEPVSGIGAWSDFSGSGTAARGILRQAAGITVPKADFVFRVLAIYLLVLAPLNWLVFRMIGRVELAWIAAPLIAIVGATAVIRMAQLDIGFARSQTDLAVLEMHEGYRRAHLTRYTALYTSLGTNYQLELADRTGLALPFSADPNFKPLLGQQTDLVTLERGNTMKLTNLQINSNTTGMAHSEQMFDCGGGIQYDPEAGTVTNGTKLTLQEAVVLRVDPNGMLEAAKLGRLAPNSNKQLSYAKFGEANVGGQTSKLFPPSEARSAEDAVNLDRLLRLALEQLPLYDEEVRLVAWSDDTLPGLIVKPEAAQFVGRSMILAHLAAAPLPEPVPDKNLRTDFDIRNSFDGEGLNVLPEDTEADDSGSS